MFAWTPYAVISIYTAFIGSSNRITPLIGSTFAIFTKSSMVWPPILCIFSDRKIRIASMKLLEIISSSAKPQAQGFIEKRIFIIFFLLKEY